MMANKHIMIPLPELRAFCQRYPVRKLSVLTPKLTMGDSGHSTGAGGVASHM